MPGFVLGLEMMPYSLGCELQLYREDSPWLLMESADFDKMEFQKRLEALRHGIDVCCKRRPRFAKLWWWMYRPATIDQLNWAINDFRNYLYGGRVQFKAELCAEGDAPLRYLGEPEILRLYRFVNTTVPRAEVELYGESAWDFPYSFAKMLSQGDAEEKGGIEIYNVRGSTHDNYHRMSEDGRAAWAKCRTDGERAAALEKHPIIRELAGLQEDVAAFEQTVKHKEDLSQA